MRKTFIVLLVLVSFVLAPSFAVARDATPPAVASPPSSPIAEQITPSDRAYVQAMAYWLPSVRSSWISFVRLQGRRDINDPDWAASALTALQLWNFPMDLTPYPPATTNFADFHARILKMSSQLLTEVRPVFQKSIATANEKAFDDEWWVFQAIRNQLDQMDIELRLTPTAAPGAPAEHTLSATVFINDSSTLNVEWGLAEGCSGSGGYSDLGPSATMVVRNQDNTIIALGGVVDSQGIDLYQCELQFLAVGVPDATFYSITIGNRNPLIYAFGDLVAVYWSLELEIGN